jgi:hypothetical protein
MTPPRRGGETAGARLAGAGPARRLELAVLNGVPGLMHAFTLRGSDPDVVLGEALGRGAPLVTLRQAHGAEVAVIDGEGPAVVPAPAARRVGDALATRREGVALGVWIADCAPILLCDPRSRAIAAVHAGWRGTVAGVLRAAIGVVRERLGARPDDLRIAIGPCIGPCCFEVGEEVVEALLRSDAGAGECVRRGARRRIDLVAANRRQALQAGARPDRIAAAGLCTVCRADLLESYRRSGSSAGRMAAIIAWRTGAGGAVRL